MESYSVRPKSAWLIVLVFILVLLLTHFTTLAQVTTHWKTTGGFNNWSRPGNWTNGVPGPLDIAVFDAGSKFCYLDIFPGTSVAGITMNGFTGSLDLNGIYKLTVTGNSTFTTGSVTDAGGNGELIFNTSGTTTFNGTAFSARITGSSGRIFFNGSTFNNFNSSFGISQIDLTKTGVGDDYSTGGNTFNVNQLTLTNSSSSVWRLADVTGDTFGAKNTNVYFYSTGTGTFQPAYNGTNSFQSGNITVNSASPMVFGAGTGIVQFSGSNAQSVSKTGVASPVMNRIEMSKASNSVTLNTDVTVGVAATFINGIINIADLSVLNFADNATTFGANNSSYVHSSNLNLQKTGDDAFTFPVGDNGYYRPISISAPDNVNYQFRAQYFNVPQSFGFNKDAAILTMSTCEYWKLDRTVGTSNVTVTLSWNSPQCPKYGITNLSHMRVLHWNSGTSTWENLGNGGTTGTTAAGTVQTAAPVTVFSPFTLGSSSLLSPLPVELIEFTAQRQGHTVRLEWQTASEQNNDHFVVERSLNGMEFISIGTVKGHGTTREKLQYRFTDDGAPSEKLYYRLKQVDLDRNFKYSNLKFVAPLSQEDTFTVYPNPVMANETVFFSTKVSIEVMDQLQRVVHRASNVESLNLAGWAPGVYIIQTLQGQFAKLIVR